MIVSNKVNVQEIVTKVQNCTSSTLIHIHPVKFLNISFESIFSPHVPTFLFIISFYGHECVLQL